MPLTSALRLALVLLLLPAAAHAETLRYDMTASGLEVARMELEIDETAVPAHARLSIRSKGLAAWIAGDYSTEMSGRTLMLENGEVRPSSFAVIYEKPDRTRQIELRYDADGTLDAIDIVNNDRSKDTEVPAELRAGTVDPLTAFLRLRQWVLSGPRQGESHEVAVFDGRKRADITATYAGSEDGTTRLAVSLVGRWGFEDGDRLVTLPGEPRKVIDVTVTREGYPLEISSAASRSDTRIRLDR